MRTAMPPPRHRADRADAVRDLRGGARLAADGLRGLLARGEALHGRLAAVTPPVRGLDPGEPGRGWPALLWRGLRGGTDLLGGSLDLALATLQAALHDPHAGRGPATLPDPARLAFLAALNALAGDHLQRTDNPLALPFALRDHLRPGQPAPLPLPHVVVLVHDLGLDDLQWRQRGHDHGEALARALPASVLHAVYNSGRHVAASGRELSLALEQRLGDGPVPLQRLDLVGHGGGGLVLRAALHHAMQAALGWPRRLGHLVFLGTPLQGCALPAGPRGWLPGAGPRDALRLGRLAGRLSDGMADVLAGRHLALDTVPVEVGWLLPPQARACAVAARVGDGDSDGLVTVDSALGRHPDPALALPLPPAQCFVADGIDHLGLLASDAVLQQLRSWLAAG